MRLPSYSYDKDDLVRHLSVTDEGDEEVIEADEYLQPAPPLPLSADNNNHKVSSRAREVLKSQSVR